MCLKMRFSAFEWRMPSIIEAWFFSSEKMTQPGILRAERAERRPVRDIAGGEEQRCFLAVQVGKLALEQHVVVVGAGDVAGAAGAGAAAVERLMHGGEHRRVLAHAEIVVGAPDRHVALAAIGVADGAREIALLALQLGKDAIAAFLVKAVELFGEKCFEIHAVAPATAHSTGLTWWLSTEFDRACQCGNGTFPTLAGL